MIRIGSNIKKIAEVGVRFKGVPRSDNPAAPHDVLTMHALNTALKQIRKAVNLGNKFLWIIVINLFFVFNCYPEIPTNTPSAGILEFFKASISSHPDIESFIVSQRDIKKIKPFILPEQDRDQISF